MSKEHLFEPLYESQNGECAICEEPLPDRYGTRIDRIVPGKDGGKYELSNCRLICLPCDWEKEGNAPNSPHPMLAAAYRTYKMWQVMAGGMDRKIKAYSGDIKGTTASPYIDGYTLTELMELRDYYKGKEKEAKKRTNHTVRELPEWKGFMKDAPGCKEILAAKLLSEVDIRKAETVSALWKFYGFDPANAMRKGNKGRNPGLGNKRAGIYAALSISVCTRKASPYRRIYDGYKAKDVGHGGALLRTVKLWMSHLWATWRKFEGLPVTAPYANNHLGHTGFYDANEFGW